MPGQSERPTLFGADLLAGGVIACEIAEPSGVLHPYHLAPCDLRMDDLAMSVTRLDSKGRPEYRVALDRAGTWKCTCMDAKYGALARRGHCKHARAVQDLFSLSEAIMAATKGTKTPSEGVPVAPSIRDLLREPFHPDEVKWKPQLVKGERAMAVAYVDARAIMDRLDDVFGLGGWRDSYQCLGADGSVLCRLEVRLGDEWIAKEDVGGQSEQPDEGDRRKAAFSDALKRTAVKYGVGRYLYHLPRRWCNYDPQRRIFREKPTLPEWALPGAKTPPPPPPEPEPQPAAATADGARPAPKAEANGKAGAQTVWEAVTSYETKLVAGGLCAPGELQDHLKMNDALAFRWGDDSTHWLEDSREEVKAVCQEFKRQCAATPR